MVTGLFVRELGELFRYFLRQEYEVDIAALRKLYPGLKDFVAWLEAREHGCVGALVRLWRDPSHLRPVPALP